MSNAGTFQLLLLWNAQVHATPTNALSGLLCERCPIGSVCDYKIDGAPIVKSTRVGIAVRTLRQKSHLSQVCLASMAKISKRTLVQTETGKTRPSKSTLRKLAKALNVNTGDLDIDSEV